jgi:hypothetical protein
VGSLSLRSPYTRPSSACAHLKTPKLPISASCSPRPTTCATFRLSQGPSVADAGPSFLPSGKREAIVTAVNWRGRSKRRPLRCTKELSSCGSNQCLQYAVPIYRNPLASVSEKPYFCCILES